MGSFGLIHEGCGFNLFNEKADDKNELCIRWIQFSSVTSFARVNSYETTSMLEQKYKDSIFNSIMLREMLSLYIYSTMIRNSFEGGSMLFPMFAFFMGDSGSLPVENLFKFEYQFMIGPNIMACPIVEPNETEMVTYFPNEILYDFYTGELMNRYSEQIKKIKVTLNKLPLFSRGGFITPIQIPPKDKPILIQEMRQYPIKLIVSLDEHYQAQGRLFIDDGISPTNTYFKIEFVCIFTKENDIKLLFQFVENKYQIPPEYYGYFTKITFYGLAKKPSVVLYQDEDEIIELCNSNNNNEEMIYNSSLKVLELNLDEKNVTKVYSTRPYRIILKGVSL